MGKTFNTGTLVNGVTVLSNGNVGIGTNNPLTKIDCQSSSTGTITENAAFRDSSTNGNALQIWNGNNEARFRAVYYGTPSDQAITFYTVTSAGNEGERMRISAAGNIGIGTSSINTNVRVKIKASSEGTGIGLSSSTLCIARAATDTQLNIGYYSTPDAWVISSSYGADGAYKPIVFATSDSERIRLTNGGTFSVNTSSGPIDSSNQKLQVYGAIRQDVLGTSYGEGYIMNFPANGTNYGGIFFHQTATAMAAVGASSIKWGLNYNYTPESGVGSGAIAFVQNNSNTRFTITSVGYVYLGKGWGATNHRINLEVSQGNNILVVSGYSGSGNDTAIFYAVSGSSANAAGTGLSVSASSATGRAINAGGTLNANGTDYAEYMYKAVTDNIAKGDIVGVNTEGKLTNIFNDSISFVVKSTNPSYVGGDIWANEDILGKKPQRTTEQSEEEFAPILAEFEERVEAERQKVDRIAFSGQVPCNVTGANVGDYIIPIELSNGKIGGQSVSNPTFEQYQISVGKVWKIMEDGRSWISVKIG